MGDSLELHPITVLLSLIFWGSMWGIPGMLLAAPMTVSCTTAFGGSLPKCLETETYSSLHTKAACKILFETVDFFRPIASLLAGDIEELMGANEWELVTREAKEFSNV